MQVLDRFRLDNKRALVTGGSRGFGRVIALALAEAGADVALSARGADDLESVATEVRQRGRKAWVFPADIGDPTACEVLCERVLAEVGDIDILVNNVGGQSSTSRSRTPISRPGRPSSTSISRTASSARR